MNERLETRLALERARAATEALLEPVPDEDLTALVSPLTAPLVWDLARTAHFEERWVLRTALGRAPLVDAHPAVHDAFRRARSDGAELARLRPSDARAYAVDVREQVLEALEDVDLEGADPLLRHGAVFGLVVQHELLHQESMLQTLQLRTQAEYPLPRTSAPDRAPGGPDEIGVPEGAFVLGAGDEPWAYDHELPPHEMELPAFFIDRAPVTNGAFTEFIDDRGYDARRLWSSEGWDWRERERARAPLFWERTGGGWERIRLGHREPVPPEEPVQHVSFHEAEAFARWAGKRLPTEAEWERAAGWHEREGKLRYPWGAEWVGYEANLGRRRFSPAPAGSYGGGLSPVWCVQMAGDVWEWTSSPFRPYPGFLAFPDPESTEVAFDDAYRVLRGGSWATDALVARTTFRTWDFPDRRQIFAGFRCARDA